MVKISPIGGRGRALFGGATLNSLARQANAGQTENAGQNTSFGFDRSCVILPL
jgi:hypothetical protein